MRRETIINILTRVVILSAVFVAAVFVMSQFINREENVVTREMEEASLPLIYINYQDYLTNELHGYISDVEVNYMRDSLTPLPADRVIPLKIAAFGTEISTVSYEIITADGAEVVEFHDAISFYKDESESYITANLEIQNNMRVNQEYVLRIILEINEQDVSYYTRIVEKSGLNIKEYLEFAHNFVNRSLNKGAEEELGLYLDTSDELGDNSSFAKVTINSTVTQVQWGDMDVELVGQVYTTINEINPITASISVKYVVSSYVDEKREYYQVNEFYRLRYTDLRMMLLNYERTVEETFMGTADNFLESGIDLGITTSDVEYAVSNDSKVITFVQNRELWSYNSSNDKLFQVFSFQPLEESDQRETYDQHDIKIIKMDDSGSVYFMVYGYFNRGKHEGENGTGIYYFSSDTNSVEEMLFIPINKPFDILREDLGNLTYITRKDMLYMMIQGTLYEFNLYTREYRSVVEELGSDSYVVADDSTYIAWQRENILSDSQNLIVLNLETQAEYEVNCGSDESIRPLGFIAEDFVYGVAKKEDIERDVLGNLIFPMYKLYICNNNGAVIREDEKDNVYIMDVAFDESMMTLTRAEKKDGTFESIDDDHIRNNIVDEEVTIAVNSYITEVKKRQMLLTMTVSGMGSDLKVMNPKQVAFGESRDIILDTKEVTEDYYYVYAYGGLDKIFKNVNNAIVRADEMVGVVVDGRMRYIWERGNLETKSAINPDSIPDAVKKGNMDVNALSESVEGKVFDLSGCTTEQIRYFVSSGRAVLGQTKEGVRLITGYDEFENMNIYNPESGEEKLMGSEDSAALFEEGGNIFISYILDSDL